MGERVRVGVLAVQGDVREHLVAIAAAGGEPVRVRRPEELAGVEGLIIPGGESTTIDKLTRIFGLREPLIERLAAGMPCYGSCAGMIMLAAEIEEAPSDQLTLGALDITVRRNAFGRQVDSFEEDLRFRGIEGPMLRAVFIRAPWVERVGPDVEVLARVEAGPAAGRIVAVRQGRVLATSFHPEITGDHRVHRLFVEQVRDATG